MNSSAASSTVYLLFARSVAAIAVRGYVIFAHGGAVVSDATWFTPFITESIATGRPRHQGSALSEGTLPPGSLEAGQFWPLRLHRRVCAIYARGKAQLINARVGSQLADERHSARSLRICLRRP